MLYIRLLDFITLIILGEEHKLLNSSLYNIPPNFIILFFVKGFDLSRVNEQFFFGGGEMDLVKISF